MGACIDFSNCNIQQSKYFMKLRGAAMENGYSLKSLAQAIGITQQAMNQKMFGRSDFTIKEMFKICNLLHRNVYIFFEPSLYNLNFLEVSKENN
jgi:DNA-binding XRE family transcriptional regulator